MPQRLVTGGARHRCRQSGPFLRARTGFRRDMILTLYTTAPLLPPQANPQRYTTLVVR